MSEEVSKLEKKRISILGCGWLGFPLAQRLQSSPIIRSVKGSTTSGSKLEVFAQAGIEGALIDLQSDPDPVVMDSFLDSDVVVVAIPPRLGKTEPGFYLQQIRKAADALERSGASEVIFVSSTSIYPDLGRVVKEEDIIRPEHSASPDMVSAENIIQELIPRKRVSVLRLSGLLGYNRIPGKYVKGQKNMTTGAIPVNYIHRDDAVGTLVAILEQGVVNETFNIVAPFHPTRREVYEVSCAQFGWEPPTFADSENPVNFKVISGEKFSQTYHYDFLFPDPLRFYYQLEENA